MPNITVNDELKAKYDSYYAGESQLRWLAGGDRARNITTLCSERPHRSILEIGAGDGSILQRLSDLQFGDALYAIEISKTAVEVIRRRNIQRLVECALFDGYNIPYEDNRFDLVVLSHVVEHLEYPRKMLYEASRVARSVFIEVPLEHTVRMSRDFQFNEVGHINFYTPKTIRRLIQTCRLEVLAQVVTNPSYGCYRYQFGGKALLKYLLKQVLLWVSAALATRLFTYQCALLCEKKTRE